MPFTGGCLCGSIRFRVTRSHLSGFNCYCQMCRRAHGGAYSTHVPMRPDQFCLDKGQLKVFASSARGFREFCCDCGAHVKVHGQTEDGSVAIPAGLFDSGTPIAIAGHIFVKDKVPWHAIMDDLPQYTGWPESVNRAAAHKRPE